MWGECWDWEEMWIQVHQGECSPLFAEYLVGEWPTIDQEGEREDISGEKENTDKAYGKR